MNHDSFVPSSPPSLALEALELNFAQQLLCRLITAYIAPYLHFFSAMYLHHQSTESSTFTVVAATTLDGHLRKKKKKKTQHESKAPLHSLSTPLLYQSGGSQSETIRERNFASIHDCELS